MRYFILSCCLLILCSCNSKKEYPYAEETLTYLEDLVEEYREAENADSLNAIHNRAVATQKRIEKEQQDSRKELIHDLEMLDENAYLIHLDLLSAESHAQWMYFKRTQDFESEEKKK